MFNFVALELKSSIVDTVVADVVVAAVAAGVAEVVADAVVAGDDDIVCCCCDCPAVGTGVDCCDCGNRLWSESVGINLIWSWSYAFKRVLSKNRAVTVRSSSLLLHSFQAALKGDTVTDRSGSLLLHSFSKRSSPHWIALLLPREGDRRPCGFRSKRYLGCGTLGPTTCARTQVRS